MLMRRSARNIACKACFRGLSLHRVAPLNRRLRDIILGTSQHLKRLARTTLGPLPIIVFAHFVVLRGWSKPQLGGQHDHGAVLDIEALAQQHFHLYRTQGVGAVAVGDLEGMQFALQVAGRDYVPAVGA
jgi:hypothetical protein